MVCGLGSSGDIVIEHGTTVDGWEFHTLRDDTFTTHWFILLIPRMTLCNLEQCPGSTTR